MQTLVVLGEIPGTNFQLTFTMWLGIVLALSVLLFAHYTWRRRSGMYIFVTTWVARFIHQHNTQ